MTDDKNHDQRDQPPSDPVPVEALESVEGAVQVTVPFGGGNDYVCPNCQRLLPPRRTMFLSKPPMYVHVLNDVIKCSWCKFIFSPKQATVLRG